MNHSLANISRLFIDANIIIYFIEKNPVYYDKIQEIFLYCYQNNIEICSSEISIWECLVWNYKYNFGREDQFEAYFQNSDVIALFPIQQEYLYDAAKLWAKNINLFDALHVVTAIKNGWDAFLTNDKKMKTDTITILQLSDI